MNGDRAAKMRALLSRNMKVSAERRRCPACQRGGGLGARDQYNDGHRTCRYCGFVKVPSYP